MPGTSSPSGADLAGRQGSCETDCICCSFESSAHEPTAHRDRWCLPGWGHGGGEPAQGYLRRQEHFEDQLLKPADYCAEQRIDLRLGTLATAIDAKQKFVDLEGGERVRYDRLLVATGGRNRTPSVPGASLDGVFQLRTVEDCDRSGDPEDPKADGELKAAVNLVRQRAAVDSAKLADEDVDLHRLVVATLR